MSDDVADGLLVDLRGISITDLLATDKDEDKESDLVAALNRILESNMGGKHSSFLNSI